MSEQHFIESIWYNRHWLVKVLWPLHLFFRFLVQFKRLLYKKKILPSQQYKKPVIVVGNISIGGTGKTPFIRELVELLKKLNIKAGIVSRGYLSEINEFPCQVSANDSVKQIGDEAYMQFKYLKIPYVIDPNRSRGVEFLLSNNQVDIVISDDGLQHYKMNRSLEIIMFDANRQFGNQMILPIGPLREPMSRLATADFVIQNGLSKYTSENYYHVKVVAINFVNLKTGKVLPLESFENIDVIAVAAIGNTQRFFTTLREFCHIKTQQTFSDHHSFVASDFDCFENDIVIMTEKDAVKCQSFSKNNWYYLQISMTFENELTEKLTQTILAITSENKPPFLL